MEQYIKKSVLVAEIEKRKKQNEEWKNSCKRIDSLVASMVIQEDINILSLIDTLETKEVDLCKEEERIWKDFNIGECRLSKNDLEKISKHFYSLGLKAQKGE